MAKRPKLPKGSGLQWNGSRLRAKLFVDGDPVYYSTGTDNIEEALKLRDAERLRLMGGSTTQALDKITIGRLMGDYITHLQQEEIGKPYKQGNHKPVLYAYNKHLKPRYERRKAAEFGTKVIEAYRGERRKEGLAKGKPVSEYTIDHELGYVRSAMKYGADSTPKTFERHLIPNFRIDKANAKKGTRHGVISFDQYQTILPKLAEWARPIFAFCMFSGARKKEATFVERANVNWETRKVTLIGDHTKKGVEDRIAEIPSEAGNALSVIKDFEKETQAKYPKTPWLFHRYGHQIKTRTLDEAFDAALLACGLAHVMMGDDNKPVMDTGRHPKLVRKVRWHDGRRFFTTATGAMPGVKDIDRQRVSGQTDQTTLRYDKNDSAAVIAKGFDAKFPLPKGKKVTRTAPNAPATTNASVDGTEAELTKLKSLFDRGLISATVYEAKQAKLLGL